MSEDSIRVPETAEEAYETAERLMECSVEEQKVWLDEHHGSAQEIPLREQDTGDADPLWLDVLSLIFPVEPSGRPDGGPFLLPLVQRLVAAGYAKPAVFEVLVPFLEIDSIIQGWANWSDVHDSEEIYYRLKVLTRMNSVPASIVPFLVFYFRSSNPILYQEAAIAVGCHLDEHQKLQQLIESYTDRYQINPTDPIQLNGERSRRRILLVLAAGISRNTLPFSTRETVPFVHPGGGTGENISFPGYPNDMNVLLRATVLLCRSEKCSREEITPVVPVLLEHVVQHLSDTTSRSLIKNWSHLFSVYVDKSSMDQESRVDLWMSMLREISRGHRRRTFSSGLASLFMIDELARTVTRFTGGSWITRLMTAVAEENSMDRIDRQFAMIQMMTWCVRSGQQPETIPDSVHQLLEKPADLPEDHPLVPGLEMLSMRRRGNNDNQISFYTGPQRSILSTVMDYFSSRTEWKSRSPGERSLAAFFAMDLCENTSMNDREVRALMEGRNMLTHPFVFKDRPGGLRSGTIQLLLTFLNWEEEEQAGAFADARFLHRIDNPEVLLTLLPSGKQAVDEFGSTNLSNLADAFDHRLRQYLKTDPEQDPGKLLALTAVRNPHPSFYDYLFRLASQRDTAEDQESEILKQWVKLFRDDMQRARQLQEDPDQAAQNWTESTWPLDSINVDPSPFLKKLLTFRRSYESLLEHQKDPVELIRRIADRIGDPLSGVPAGTRTLFTLLDDLYDGDQSLLLQSGQPAWREETLLDLEKQLENTIDQLKALSSQLQTNLLSPYEKTVDLIGEFRNRIPTIRTKLLRSIPQVDEVVFDILLGRLDEHLARLLSVLDNIHRIREKDQSIEHQETMFELFDNIQEVPSADLRETLYREIWTHSLYAKENGEPDRSSEQEQTLASRNPGAGVIPEPGEWVQQHSVLKQGLKYLNENNVHSSDRTTLRSLFQSTWQGLLEYAMEQGEERRVNQLLRDPDYEEFRTMLESEPVLDSVRSWWFDRYTMDPLYTTVNRSESGNRMIAGIRHVFSYLFHFTPVWIGLIVGAFFMLDFGDPWTAMAREGDIDGVLITFGIGLLVTYLFLFLDLQSRVSLSPEDHPVLFWGRRALRLLMFLGICLIYAFAVVGFFWYLLSGTGEVVTGSNAFLHIVVWTGFTFFVGVLFGLLVQQ